MKYFLEIRFSLIMAFIMFLCVALGGCSTPEEKIVLPADIGLESDQLNKFMTIDAPKVWNDFKIGDTVTFYLEIKTDVEFKAPPNFNVKIYLFNDGTSDWEKIEDFPTVYTDPSDIILKQGDSHILSYTPLWDDHSSRKKAKLLFVVSGDIIQGEEVIGQTGAYAIVNLTR